MMKMRRRRVAARQHEGAQRLQLGVEQVDFALQAQGLPGGDPQGRRAAARRGHAQIGADVEQLVLNPFQHRIEFGKAAGMQPRQSHRGVGFIHAAVCFDARVGLGQALAGAERGGAVVAGARVDAVQDHHDRKW